METPIPDGFTNLSPSFRANLKAIILRAVPLVQSRGEDGERPRIWHELPNCWEVGFGCDLPNGLSFPQASMASLEPATEAISLPRRSGPKGGAAPHIDISMATKPI